MRQRIVLFILACSTLATAPCSYNMFSENLHFFEKLSIFLIETKIPHEKIKFLKNTISLKGGFIVTNPSTADVILTILKSPARISRYIGSETRKPIVSIEWVDKWYAFFRTTFIEHLPY